MEATRRQEIITEDGQLHLAGLPYKQGEVVEVIILPLETRSVQKVLTAGQLRQSGVIGLWKDRTDIRDSSAYARQLRKQATRRGSGG